VKERNLFFHLGKGACPCSCTHVYPRTVVYLFDKYVFAIISKYSTCYHFDFKQCMLPSYVVTGRT